jgi:outer membrane protein assembly factor BamB
LHVKLLSRRAVIILLAFFLITTALLPKLATGSPNDSPVTEWNEWQGSSAHNGLSAYPGPLTNHVLWNREFHGQLEMIEKDGNLIVAQAQGLNLGFAAVSASNGTTLYNVTTYPHASSIYNGYLRSENIVAASDLIAAGIVIAATGDSPELMTFHSDSGSVAWYDNTSQIQYLTYFNGVLYAVEPSLIQAYNPSTGNPIWSRTVNGSGVGSLPTGGGSVLLVPLNNNTVSALDPATGANTWNLIMGSSVSTVPTYGEGLFFFGSLGGTFNALSQNGSKVWSDRLLLFGSAVVSDGVVYAGASNGTLFALDALNGTVRWSIPLKDPISSSPVMASNGLIYVATDSSLYAVNANDTIEWSFTLNSTPNQLLLYKGDLFISTSDGTIYAFGETSTTTTASSPSASGTTTSSTETSTSQAQTAGSSSSTTVSSSRSSSLLGSSSSDSSSLTSFSTSSSSHSPKDLLGPLNPETSGIGLIFWLIVTSVIAGILVARHTRRIDRPQSRTTHTRLQILRIQEL